MESIFFLLLVVEAFSLQKVVEMLEGGSQLVRGQVNMVGETKLHSPTHSTCEALVVQHAVGVVTENWAFSVDQCQFQALQFSVHLIDLLSILLRCKDSAGIQKAVVDQTGSRTPVTKTFFGYKFG